MSLTLTRFDGVMDAQVEGPLDPTLPLVILLHGLSGTSGDMTSPLTARPGTAYDRTANPGGYMDRGFAPTPPLLPADSFFLDPAPTSLTSWQDALVTSGLSTVVYSQRGPLIANDAAQLTALALAIDAHPQLMGLRVAIVAHSRGGLVARAFLRSAAGDPRLTGFMSRTSTLVTLHSPHLGSGIASIPTTVDGLLAVVQASIAALGAPPPAFLAALRGMVMDPVVAELAIGTPTASIAPGEPVAGVTYHTFGGTSLVFSRLWATMYTPDSYLPWPVPWPMFHWGVAPVPIGAPLDAASFGPLALALAPFPPVTQLIAALTALVGSTPELTPGFGDLLVTDARARLPFAVSHTTNALNHAEALWDPTLQSQVATILLRLRTAPGPVAGQAEARTSPYPARLTAASHTVTAKDSGTGAAITSGAVRVRDTYGNLALQGQVGVPFTYSFKARRLVTIDDDGNRDVELLYPTVEANLPAPYGLVAVDTGRF
jgi:hypothetical protein